MFINRWICLGLLAIVLASCAPDGAEKNNDNAQFSESANGEATAFSNFLTEFNAMQLPYFLPSTEAAKEAEVLDKDFVKKYLDNKPLSPAFGSERIAPEVSENLDGSTYYSESRLVNTQGYTGIVLRKENNGVFYYLFTFSP